MARELGVNNVMLTGPWQQRLHLPNYTIKDAARYAQANDRTVSYWFRGSALGPVLPGKENRAPLSYLQLVEVAFVSTARKLGVPMPRIRKAREYLVERFGSPYPFAEYRLKTEGSRVLVDLTGNTAEEEDLLALIASEDGQIGWNPIMSDRFAQFEYMGGLAIRWKPMDGSPVIIDPRFNFGAPNVYGVATWVIKNRFESGERPGDIAADFDLPEADVIQALAFEGATAV